MERIVSGAEINDGYQTFVCTRLRKQGSIGSFIMSCAVPMGLRNEVGEPLFPTLKRGANQLCASGAFV